VLRVVTSRLVESRVLESRSFESRGLESVGLTDSRHSCVTHESRISHDPCPEQTDVGGVECGVLSFQEGLSDDI
jgi:hypothetical protein